MADEPALTFDYDPDASLLVRTDFTDDAAWDVLVVEASSAYGHDSFSAALIPVSDTAFERMAAADLARIDGSAPFVFAADRESMVGGDKSVVVVDRKKHPGRTFRVVLHELWGVENNLRLANMDFEDFARAADSGGVFRGFATR
jgi:hypothetical protein